MNDTQNSISNGARNRASNRAGNRTGLILIGIGLLLAGAAGGWFWQTIAGGGAAASLAKGDRAAIEQVVRDYILANPEILPEAMENLQKKEKAKQLAGVGNALEKPFPGAVLGNPDGDVVLVTFTDYGCTYCRQSVADVEALVRDNPDLKVVVRELPILSPESGDAARWGLAAARQGRYSAFHHAMFAAGRPDAATIEAAAKVAGLDLGRARKELADRAIEAEINRNLEMARSLGFNGTPSWAIGEELLSGAVGREVLQKAVDTARDAA